MDVITLFWFSENVNLDQVVKVDQFINIKYKYLILIYWECHRFHYNYLMRLNG